MEKRHIELTPEERAHLLELVSKGTQPVKTYRRAQGLLAMDEGKTLQAVKQQVGVSYQTVSKWRDSFVAGRLSMLSDKPRPGRPPEIDGLQRASQDARKGKRCATYSPFGSSRLLAHLPLAVSCLRPWLISLLPVGKSSRVECL